MVKDGKLYIGDDAILDVPGAADGQVHAAIRPEGFIPNENGELVCSLSAVEVMGRDISVVSTHKASQNTVIRSIISAENTIDLDCDSVRFSVKPNKVFIFHKETQERVRFEIGG